MIAAFGLTDIGRQRETNQDSDLVDVLRQLYVVADGLGGHACGDRASRLAVEAGDRFATAERLRQAQGRPDAVEDVLRLALYEAHSAVRAEARRCNSCWDMGTTLLAAIVDGSTVHVLAVGDSLAYRVAADGIERLNRAHRARIRTADAGWMRLQEFLSTGRADQITQYVGRRRALKPSG